MYNTVNYIIDGNAPLLQSPRSVHGYFYIFRYTYFTQIVDIQFQMASPSFSV